MEKPTECCICFEDLSDGDKPLVCGHIIHIACVSKHFKPECPLCRTPLNIQVSGTRPENVIVGGITEEDYEEEEYTGAVSAIEPYYSERNIDQGIDNPGLGEVNEVEFNHFFEREDFLPEFGRNKRRRADTPSVSDSEDEVDYDSY